MGTSSFASQQAPPSSHPGIFAHTYPPFDASPFPVHSGYGPITVTLADLIPKEFNIPSGAPICMETPDASGKEAVKNEFEGGQSELGTAKKGVASANDKKEGAATGTADHVLPEGMSSSPLNLLISAKALNILEQSLCTSEFTDDKLNERRSTDPSNDLKSKDIEATVQLSHPTDATKVKPAFAERDIDESRMPSSTPTSNSTKPQRKNRSHTPRPSNSFILYRKEKHAEIVKKNQGGKKMNNKVISKIVAEMWNKETAEVKAHYSAKAEEKREHQEKHPNYKYRPRKVLMKGMSPSQSAPGASFPFHGVGQLGYSPYPSLGLPLAGSERSPYPYNFVDHTFFPPPVASHTDLVRGYGHEAPSWFAASPLQPVPPVNQPVQQNMYSTPVPFYNQPPTHFDLAYNHQMQYQSQQYYQEPSKLLESGHQNQISQVSSSSMPPLIPAPAVPTTADYSSPWLYDNGLYL
ncbi:hypothetical protein HK102_003288 [Quaeritorhiza haematococci]|nr:hypothetical protein HK102_003288 [Quaeritorhiza haematococci]